MEYTYTSGKHPCEVLSDKSDHIRQYTDGVESNSEAIHEMCRRLVELFDVAEPQGGSGTVKLPTSTVMRHCEMLTEMSLVASYRSGVMEDLMATVLPRYKEISEIPASIEYRCDRVLEISETILSLGKVISERAAMIMDHFATIADSYTAVLRSIEEQMRDPAAVSRLLKKVADNSARIRERHKKVEEYTEALVILCLSAVPPPPEEIN